MKVIFVAGTHAVGKSTACKAASEVLGFSHYSASQIIRGEKLSAVSISSKLVANVADNQRFLIKGVDRLSKQGNFLLDGHFTVRRKSDEAIEAIHVDIFKELSIAGVILFVDAPEAISKRIFERDGISPSLEFIAGHQNAEIAHAKHVSSLLEIPIITLQAFDTDSMVKSIRSWESASQVIEPCR